MFRKYLQGFLVVSVVTTSGIYTPGLASTPEATPGEAAQERPEAVPSLESILHQVSELREEQRRSVGRFQEWRKKNDEIRELLQEAGTLAQGSPDRLMTVAEAAQQVGALALAIDAAREALQGAPAVELRAHRVLANCLWRESWFFEKQQEKEKVVAEALGHAQILVDRAGKPSADDLNLLASLLEGTPGRRAEAFSRFQQALAAARKENVADLRPYYRGLTRTSKDFTEATAWFKESVGHGGAEEADWTALAWKAEEAQNFGTAGEAWSKAGELAPSTENLCRAGLNFWRAEQPDNALAAYRKCVEVGAFEEGAEGQLAQAYSNMSTILYDRGVYDQSITYAKQALELSPDDPFAYLDLSRSLNALGRNVEAVTAAENAIRLSDGKYSVMHFALGLAHFGLRNWERSARAFQKAAELAPTDPEPAFNVAVCMQEQRLFLEGARWLEEVLKRKPDHPQREEILKKIRTWRE